LRYNKGYSLKKVGELMVLKDSTIKMKLLRLKQKIAKKINPTVNLKGE
jgi:DNA-directed RNA polymerase specialized sigma24 family protein